MNKRGKTLIAVGIFMILAILIMSPFIFSVSENVKVYDEETKTVLIKDKDSSDISEVQLLTPLHNKVGLGYQRIAEFEVSGKMSFDDFYGSTKTYDKKKYDKGERTELGRQFDWKYLNIYLVEESNFYYQNLTYDNGTFYTSIIQNGTHWVERERWVDFDKKTKIKKDENLTIGLYTEVQKGDYVEWIPYFAGLEIDEWATWIEIGVENYVNSVTDGWGFADMEISVFQNVTSGFLKAFGIHRADGSSASVYRVHINQSGSNLATKDINIAGTDNTIEYANFTSEDYSGAITEGAFTIDLHRISGDVKIDWKISQSYEGSYFSFYDQYMPWTGVYGVTITYAEVSVDTAPTVSASSSPETLFTNTDYFVNLTVNDSDAGDTLTGYVQFYKNDVPLLGEFSENMTNATSIHVANLSSGNYTFGDIIIAEYWAGDGTVNTSKANHTSETIQINTPPILVTNVTKPDTIYSNTNYLVNLTARDSEEDYLNAWVKFYINDVGNETDYVSISNNTNTLVGDLSSNFFSKYDNLTAEVWVGDGTENTTAVNLTTVNIPNSIPTHNPPLLKTSSRKNLSTEDLTCNNQSTSDADNDNVINIYNWFKDAQSILSLNLPFEINANDYSGAGNDGSVSGASLVSGKLGNAYSFDGNDNITISDSSMLDFINEKTWQLWFKRSGTGAETLFNKGNETETNYKLEFLSDDKLKFSYSLGEGTEFDLWEVITESGFNEGTFTNTTYNNSEVVLDGGSLSGIYESKVFNDSEKLLSFNTLGWNSEIPLVELIPESDMVLLMHMNELSGNITDFSGKGNNGTNNGAEYGVEGKINTALGFDGVGDYILSSSNSFNVEDGTLEFWAKSNWLTGTGAGIFFSWDSNEAGDWGQIRLAVDYDSNTIYFTVDEDDNNNNDGQYTYSEFSDDEWVHFLGTWKNVNSGSSNGEVRLYVNGDGKTPTTGVKIDSTTINTDINNVYIGVHKTSGFVSFFNGSIDELAVWNRTLSASEALEIYESGVEGIINLSLSVRSCDDNSCSGESFVDMGGDSSQDISSLSNNKYFQFKFDFETDDVDSSPQLFNVTMNYSKQITDQEVNITSTAITDTNWHLATITFSDESSNNLKLYLEGSLDKQKTETSSPNINDEDLIIGSGFNGSLDEFRIYDHALSSEQIQAHYVLDYNTIVSEETAGGDVYSCDITPNDGEVDGVMKSSENLSVLYAIEFNVISGEDGGQISNFDISCDNGFSSSSENSPFTTGFESATYVCIFTKTNYFGRTSIFTADEDKTVDVKLSLEGSLTIEEHTWLEAIYNCINGGNCALYNLLLEVNTTVGNIWEQTKPTDESVITFENVTNKVVDSSNNLTIDYTVDIPIKAGYGLGDYLPVRIGFWFLDETNTTCYNQGDRPTGVSDPYCQPLIVETIGPMGGSVSFTVELQPELPVGNYSIKRIIDIDPLGVWYNYGQEVVSSFTMLESLGTYGIGLETTGESNPSTETESSSSSSSSSGGGSGGGGDSSVTNVYNTYNTIEGEEIEEESGKNGIDGGEEESGKSWITGGVIGAGLLSGGQIVIVIAVIGLVLVVFIISRTKLRLKKKIN